MTQKNIFIDQYTEALDQVQQSIVDYKASIEKLLDAIELRESEWMQKRCKTLLSMTVQEIEDIQHLSHRKAHLLQSVEKD